MLFNSFTYIFAFFPLVVFIYFFFNSNGYNRSAKIWLVLVSFIFLGWNSPFSVSVLICSVLVNFFVGLLLIPRDDVEDGRLSRLTTVGSAGVRSDRFRKVSLLTGVLFNIFLLGFFKYHNFFLPLTNFPMNPFGLGIPLAISFYSFQQIAFLVDTYRGQARETNILNYFLFISFFPRILMGPICRHRELMPQFSKTDTILIRYDHFALGLYIFFIGLCKRVVIADTFGVYADYGYSSLVPLTFCEAWITTLSYTFQIYFDFSGYTDMAIGSAYFFNIRLPINFSSPYLALNIQEFWRRWHITLSRFLRDYIYIPLGGSRNGEIATYINILVTFLIAGLWHGAGWSFIVWGGLHGLALVACRAWRQSGLHMPKTAAFIITFSFINMAWVFFRANDIPAAYEMLKAMMGVNGFWGILAFGSIEFLDKITGLAIAVISIMVLFFAGNTNAIPVSFKTSNRQLARLVAVILLGLFFLNSILPKGFIYLDF